MKIHSKPNNISTVLSAAVVLTTFGLLGQSASAALTYDLRAVSVTGVGSVSNAKTVIGTDIGSVVNFNIFAVVTGADTDASNESYAFGYFGILASNGNNAVGGNLGNNFTGNTPGAGVLFDAQWNATSQPGQIGADRNADGTFDIGPAVANATAANYAKARSLNPSSGALFSGGTQFGGGSPGAGQEFLLGTIQFKVMSVTSAVQTTSINFNLPAALGVTVKANWKMDNGTLQNTQGVSGADVTIAAVPEPSAFGMVLVGALGLVGFRRLGFRRTA